MAEDKNLHPQQAIVGLNMEGAMGQKPQGSLSYALNATVQSFDGEAVVYQSEQSNQYCLPLPAMFKAVGVFNITQLDKVIYFLTNPETGDSQIGYTDNNDCKYHILVEGACLNFDIRYPIHQIIVKSTDCSTQFYWTDNYNPRRYIDLDKLPWKEEINPDNDFAPIQLVGQLDCNKILVQPIFNIPSIHGEKEIIGGILKMGAYQAVVQYANVLGDGLSPFFNISNPFGIFKEGAGMPLDAETNKAIQYSIENLDTSGLYDYYNIAIIKTINGISSDPELVAKGRPIKGSTDTFLYTGTEVSPIKLTMEDIFRKNRYYDKAAGVFEVDGVLGWYDLTSPKDLNYQEITNKLKAYWVTHRVPYNDFEAYKNGLNTEILRGYMRDEVYPFEIVPIHTNGRQDNGFHWPGRPANQYDLEGVLLTNKDAAGILNEPCDEPENKSRWQVYNTGTLIGYTQEYLDYIASGGDINCYTGSYQYGEMAYWESTDTYPNNPTIWGDLAGKPIRHHKFPDSTITRIHDDNITGEKGFTHAIFPIGVRIEGVKEAIESSSLTQEEKDNLIGFKVIRGNRATNKSIVAKGMFNNVGKYTYIPHSVDEEDEQTYYYANYPFNDLRPDPFFTDIKIRDHAGYRPDRRLKGFETEDSKSRFVFYSPDTQFKTSPGINSGHLKIETIEYGESYGHFVPVKENSKYLFLNKNGQGIAYSAGIASIVNGTVTYTTPWNFTWGGNLAPENFPVTYQGMIDLLEKIMPKSNFGYSFNSVGYYNKSYAVPNDGNKIRNISFGKYLKSEYETVESGNTINNYQREGSVYLNTTDPLLFPHEYDVSIPEDTSRYNIASYTGNDAYDKFLPIFIADNSVVMDDDIIQGIYTSVYGGADVINIQYTGNSTGIVTYSPTTPPTSPNKTVSIYRKSTGALLGTLDIIAAGHNVSGSAFDGDFTGILIGGSLTNLTAPLVLDSSNTSGTGSSVFVYKDTPRHREEYVWPNSPGVTPVHFDTLVSESYQSYALTRPDEIDSIIAKVKVLLAGITSEADVLALNVANPNGNADFISIVAYEAYIGSFSRFQQGLEKEYSPDKIRPATICSYYGSIKRVLPNQWGSIYSYETVDTGFYSTFRKPDGTFRTEFPSIFGGDTFINRYGFKIKLPFFEENTVANEAPQPDIEYDKIASLTYPMFWISTRPPDIRNNITDFLKKKAQQIANNSQSGLFAMTMLAGLYAIQISVKIITEILSKLGIRNLNLDNFQSGDVYEKGIMYLFSYGIPYYFCESDVNVDYRHAKDDREGNFYPNVAGDIPDNWLQEVNVSILQPEQFNYNVVYSKQSTENFFSHLRLDYDPDKACFYKFQNRSVWSDKSSLEETKNNWLTYRPASEFEFPKSFGKLIALNKLENRVMLARFENKSQLYNTMLRINTSNPEAAYIGNDSLFSGAPPIDLTNSTGGSFGSQHKFMLITEQGNIFLDAKRGQVGLLRGSQQEDISQKGMDKWFKHYLPFFILEVDQNIPIDNHFNGIGLTGVYDTLYKRAIITKRDYEPIVDGITYNENSEFIFEGKVINLEDSNYFCDRSWTLSYSFITQSWTSFHSYQPNFYIEHSKYFQSGINDDAISSIWDHNLSFTSTHNYYGTTYPYILEYPIAYQFEDEILQNVKDYTKALKYTSYEEFTSPKETYYFNKAVIWNDQQCSGIRVLVPKKGLGSYGTYPKYNQDSIEIQVTKSDNFFQWNDFWNIVKDPDEPIWKKACSSKHTNKSLNFSNLEYGNKSFRKATIRAKECYIRLIQDDNSAVRLISRFIVSPTVNSKL